MGKGEKQNTGATNQPKLSTKVKQMNKKKKESQKAAKTTKSD